MTDRFKIRTRETLKNIIPYSPGKPIWELQSETGREDIIKLASNENPLGPSPKAVEAVLKSIQGIHRYPDAGTARLRQALGASFNLHPDQFLVSNGGDELIKLVAETFLSPDDEVVMCSPSFSQYEFGAHLMGATLIHVPLEESYELDICSIAKAVSSRTKLVCICSPNNPTGTYISRDALQNLLNLLPSHVVILLDAAYSHYATAIDYTDGIEFVRNGYPIIVLQTFSKIYGLAGLRIGFGIAPEAIIQYMTKVKEPFNVNSLAQAAAVAALQDSEHIQKTLELTNRGKQQLYHGFQHLGIAYIESMSNFVLAEVGGEAKRVYEGLLKQGVIVRYGGIWNLPHHLRISVGLQDENEMLLSKMEQLLL